MSIRTFSEYDRYVATGIRPSRENGDYLAIALGGEVGETLNAYKHGYRQGHEPKAQDVQNMIYELGDVLWYLTAFAHQLGFTLEEIVDANKSKLDARYEL